MFAAPARALLETDVDIPRTNYKSGELHTLFATGAHLRQAAGKSTSRKAFGAECLPVCFPEERLSSIRPPSSVRNVYKAHIAFPVYGVLPATCDDQR